MTARLSIAVIGAGVGGLATAAALLRAGVDVTVYEQARKFARLGAGIRPRSTTPWSPPTV